MKNFLKKYNVLLLFLVMAAIVVIMVVMTSFMMSNSSEMIEESSSKKLITASMLISELVYGEELEELFDWDKVNEDEVLFEKYVKLQARLAQIAEIAELEYAYFLYLNPEDNLMYFVMDHIPIEDRSTYTPNPGGGVAREEVPDAVMATKTPICTELGSYSDGYENYMTAYAPVYRSTGELIALAGADAQDQLIIEAQSNNTMLTVVLIISVTALLLTGVVALTIYNRKATLAESANVAKSSFLSRMSHEMRTPMNAVMGLCRMAKEADDPKKVDEYLDNIASASKHLRQVIDDILDLSKIESGKVMQELVEVDFFKEVANVEVIIKTSADAKRQSLTFDVDPEIPQKVICDSTHLKQVLLNLLSNAVKFTPEEGAVSLSVKMLENDGKKCNLLWKIQDNGIGIDKENIDKLFRPFEQGDNSTTRKFGGTGLGLAISKQYVEMMDGTIRVESEKDKGSAFIFNCVLHIPGSAGAPAVKQEVYETFETPDLTGKCILVVEDAELNRLIAENLFIGYGAEVEMAEDGQEGYEKYCENPEKYAMIFMDIQMPVLDGYSSSRKIRESGKSTAKTIPIIAMTADVFREDVEKAIAAGMNAHVGKPFETEQIERAIFKVLNAKK